MERSASGFLTHNKATVVRMERSASGFFAGNKAAPDFASLHPGYLLLQ